MSNIKKAVEFIKMCPESRVSVAKMLTQFKLSDNDLRIVLHTYSEETRKVAIADKGYIYK